MDDTEKYIKTEDGKETAESDKREDTAPVRRKKIFSYLKLALLALCIIGIPLALYLTHPDIIEYLKSFENINDLLETHAKEGVLIYIGVSVLQVIVAVIPGQALYFAAGYVYSVLPGILLAMSGCLVGTTISFALARILGREAVELLFGEKKVMTYSEALSTKKGYLIMFILYLIPGFPKDLIGYAAGVSKADFRPFILISTVGRFPACAATVVMGDMLKRNSWSGIIVLGIIALLLCAAAFLMRDRLLKIK